MNHISNYKSRNIVVLIMILILLVSSLTVVTAMDDVESVSSHARTGNQNNQPTTGYSEGADIFEIYNKDGIHTTSFSVDDHVYVRLTSPRVEDLDNSNILEVRTYDDNRVIDLDPAFIQTSSSSPFIYESSFIAPGPADHYLIEVEIEDNNGEIFRTFDVIIVGAGSSPMKYIRTYSDPDYTTLESTFASTDTVYIEVYQNAQPIPGNSRLDFRDYQDNREALNINDFQNKSLEWHLNNYARIVLDLENDISWQLEDEYWYSISTEIRNNAGTDICQSWSTQIQIRSPPDISSDITNVNSPVDVAGANLVTISAQFTNPEILPVSSFTVSFKLRAPDDSTEILLVDQQTHGGAGGLGGILTITLDTMTNIYSASYSFDPTEAWSLGDYDLYFSVSNPYGQRVDGYNNNRNELNLYNSLIQPPEIAVGVTKCIPSSVDIFGTGTVTIYSEFTDVANSDISTFTITFRIRQPGEGAITLVNNKGHGGAGEFGGTVSIIYSGGIYTVSYTWDPDPSFLIGSYDLFFEVDDGVSGTEIDDFVNNQNELMIINSNNPPEIKVGATTVVPSSLDKIGEGAVTIFSEFSDSDMPNATVFQVIFKVRDPENNEIILVDNKYNGGLGEFGNIVHVDFSGTIYTASITWDPDETVLPGWYDLYFQVNDGIGNIAEDGFDANRNELQIVSSITAPIIDDTTCIPSSVNKIGSGTTTIFTTFSDEKYLDIANFSITFKVRAPDDTIYNLTNNAGHSDIGEYGGTLSITYSGTIFTASYQWNPPDDILIGKYDLYCSIRNEGGGIATDGYDDNRDKLQIETTENPPEIFDTQCIPSSVSVLGVSKTQLIVTFTDDDNPPVDEFLITIKVRDESNNEIIILEDKLNGISNVFSEILTVSFSGTEYTASIFWDPNENVYSGKYDLFSSVKDKSGTLIEHGFDENHDELILTDGPKIGSPTIESTYVHNPESNEYNFTVNYTDSDNDAPNEDGVILSLDGKDYQMMESDPSDKNYEDGKEYYYVLTLDDGNYDYSFKVKNSDNEVYESDESTLDTEPDAKKTSSETSNSLFIIAIIAIIIIVILLIVTYLILKKRAKPPMAQTRKNDDIYQKDYEPNDDFRDVHEPEQKPIKPEEEVIQPSKPSEPSEHSEAALPAQVKETQPNPKP